MALIFHCCLIALKGYGVTLGNLLHNLARNPSSIYRYKPQFAPKKAAQKVNPSFRLSDISKRVPLNSAPSNATAIKSTKNATRLSAASSLHLVVD